MDVIWIVFAHYIGDWALQSDWMAKNKFQFGSVMVAHAMIWAACVSVALEYSGQFSAWKVWFLVLGHIVVDIWKCWASEGVPFEGKPMHKYMYIDQAIHLAQCAFCSLVP